MGRTLSMTSTREELLAIAARLAQIAESLSAPGRSDPETLSQVKPMLRVVQLEIERQVSARTGNPPSWTPGNLRAAGIVAQWVESAKGDEAMVKALMEQFYANEWASSVGWPLMALAGNPQKYLTGPQASQSRALQLFEQARAARAAGQHERARELTEQAVKLRDERHA